MDTLVGAFFSCHKKLANPGAQRPFKILLTNGAHLGDVVLSTLILQRLKSTYPLSTIGIVVGSWSTMVVNKHPLIDYVYVVDHWQLNRSSKAIWSKFLQYKRTYETALAKIKAEKYDVAIDLYFYFPNSIMLLYQSGIPRRIAFNSAGLGPLLTDSIDWQPGLGSIVNYFHLLVDQLGDSSTRCSVDSAYEAVPALYSAPLSFELPSGKKIALHIGTGGKFKEWPVLKWKELAHKLETDGYQLIFTGAGDEERRKIEFATSGLKKAINLCGALSWGEFLSTIRNCDFLVGVDSVACHVAAALGVPSLTLANGVQDPNLWKPCSTVNTVIRHPVGCFPCYRPKGCHEMACIQLIEVDDVRELIHKKLT